MKNYLLLFLTLLTIASQCQSDQINQDKYWGYRDRLVRNFMKVGNEAGHCLPMAARRIGFTTYDETFNGEQQSSFYWQDCNVFMAISQANRQH
jgi:hypothetical protein